MKKAISFALSALLLLSLAGCAGRQSSSSAASGTQGGSSSAASSGGTSSAPDSSSASEPDESPASGAGKTLVVYYSATGSTEAVAQTIADETGGDLFALVPTEPYTSDDLNWTDENSRVSLEHNDESLRDVPLTETVPDGWESYNTVFVGYPIWWGIAAWPVDGFIAANDFTGKTVIPFCTSSSSGLGESGSLLADAAGTGDWQEGMRFNSRVSEEDVRTWVQGLGLAAPAGQPDAQAHILIAYFSMPEAVDTVDAVAGASIVVRDGDKLGSTEYVAGLIQQTVGGDLFRIEAQQDYPLDHDPLVDQAADEQAANMRPPLESMPENLDQYDTVILGFPNWWADLPMPVYTFLEGVDLTGKTVIPFVTHGGSGFSGTLNTIARLQPGAEVSGSTLSLSRNDVAASEQDVIAWAQGLGLAG